MEAGRKGRREFSSYVQAKNSENLTKSLQARIFAGPGTQGGIRVLIIDMGTTRFRRVDMRSV